MGHKSIKRKDAKNVKQTKQMVGGLDKETPVWCFNNADNDGLFRLGKETVDSALMIDKLLSLSKMTWLEIKTATHDDGKSKNHGLNYEGFSQEAKDRVKVKKLSDEDIDAIFSIAFTNAN